MKIRTTIIAAACAVGLAGLIAPAAEANSTTGSGLCAEGFAGKNSTTGAALADFESPQKGVPQNLFTWERTARGASIWYAQGMAVTSTGTGKTYCQVTGHWDKSTGFGSGEDYSILSYVVFWNDLGTTFQPVAYNTYNGATYWRADSNGATSNFDVAMPWGGTSNFSYPAP